MHLVRDFTWAHWFYAVMVTLALGTLAFGAPAGGFLVTDAPKERVQRDPSIRTGSRGHWFFVGGGYHGGK